VIWVLKEQKVTLDHKVHKDRLEEMELLVEVVVEVQMVQLVQLVQLAQLVRRVHKEFQVQVVLTAFAQERKVQRVTLAHKDY
jgi:hypothetical protein